MIDIWGLILVMSFISTTSCNVSTFNKEWRPDTNDNFDCDIVLLKISVTL